jgi:hypothetical protein
MPNTPPQAIPATTPRPERRAHRRAPLGRPVLIETDTRSEQGRLLNVSGGGAAIETAVDLALGESVSLYFELPIGYAVETRAEVLRRDGSEVAVRFVELSREAQVALRSFCRISGLHKVSG